MRFCNMCLSLDSKNGKAHQVLGFIYVNLLDKERALEEYNYLNKMGNHHLANELLQAINNYFQ